MVEPIAVRHRNDQPDAHFPPLTDEDRPVFGGGKWIVYLCPADLRLPDPYPPRDEILLGMIKRSNRYLGSAVSGHGAAWRAAKDCPELVERDGHTAVDNA